MHNPDLPEPHIDDEEYTLANLYNMAVELAENADGDEADWLHGLAQDFYSQFEIDPGDEPKPVAVTFAGLAEALRLYAPVSYPGEIKQLEAMAFAEMKEAA